MQGSYQTFPALTLKEVIMKVAVTAKGAGLGAWIDDDFVHCKQIVVVDENNRFEAWSNPFKDDPSHEAAIQLAKWIVDEGIKLLITNEISPQSREVLENADVVVYQAKEGAVLTLVEKARNGMVKNE
jgi:predicted Fe-Mo cluster-binding NifX family protein